MKLIMKRIALLLSMLISLPVSAQGLPDGRYIDWEEEYIIKNGQLISCTGAGKNGSSCAGIRATYASPQAIKLTRKGHSWLVCNAKFKKAGGMGPPGSGGFCTVNGWN